MSTHRTFPISVQPGIPKLNELKSGWGGYLIGQLFDEVKRPANIQDDQKYRLVTVRRSRGGLAPRSELFGKEIAVKSQYFIRSGDFLISKRQIVHGACAIVTDDFDGAIVSNEYSVLRCKDSLRLDYLAQLFHSVYLQQTFFHSSIGVHIEKMIFKLEDWFKWPVNLPPLLDQQKTASFLSSVDQKIEQLGRKKQLLEQYKKDIMQKLLSQELRFKEDHGNDFPDWEEKRFNEVATKTASSVTAQSLKQTPGEYPVFGASGIAGYVNFYNSDVPHISVVKDGAGVGRVFVCPEKSSVLGTLDSIVAVGENYTAYLYYWLSNISFAPYKTGSTIPHIYFRDYGKKRSYFPQPNEQKKIADFLSVIDQKINLVATELDHTKSFKHGLLQQMFI